jgi:hypothetical protein
MEDKKKELKEKNHLTNGQRVLQYTQEEWNKHLLSKGIYIPKLNKK